MDVRQAQCFVALIEEGSFTKAAQRVFATQPGISLMISGMEKDFGVRLVERHARGVTPTHAGERLYARSLEILRAVEKAKGEMAELKDAVVGEVAFGMPPTFCMEVATSILTRFTADYPHVDLKLVEAFSAELVQGVSNHKLEFAVATSTPTERGLELSLLHRDHFVLIAGLESADALAAPMRLQDLPPLKLIMPSRQQTLGAVINRLIQVHGLRVARILEVDGLVAAVDMVRRSDWVSFMPTIALGGEIANGPFKIIPLDELNTEFEYYLVRAATAPSSRPAGLLIDYMRQELAKRQTPSHNSAV
jgi:LysR family nitrogen assimilation transcriptional regulator